MHPDFRKLNRFTSIPFLIDLLKRQKLTLLNPRYWEDYNDRETMELYRRNINAEALYALCFTHGSETIHHWNAFAGGTGGCCVEFSPERLFKILDADERIVHGKVEYLSLRSLPKATDHNLPFVKRQPFAPEKEYRIIAATNSEQHAFFEIDIDINTIRRITINNKIPHSVYQSIKESLLQIAPNYKGKIYHSTLYSNPVWINHFRNKL